jgi:hypothetical protein
MWYDSPRGADLASALSTSPTRPEGRALNRFATVVVVLLTATLVAVSAPASVSAATAPQTDVMFVFDTSGSMGGVLEEAKAEIQEVMARLEGSLPSVEFGLAEVRDYGGSEYDPEPEIEPWKLDMPVTSNVAGVSEAISALYATGGGDGPEAYGRALWETDTNPNVGWRPGARHLIVLVADQVPHDPNVDEGIPEEFWAAPSPWDTGEELPGTWGIPGTQLKAGETLDFHSVLRQLASDGKPLEMVDYHDTDGDYIHYWESWAALAGGTAVEADEGGNELASKLIPLVERAPEDTACATSATATEASPTSLRGLPTALTPRFLQAGTPVVLTPAGGKEFCAGQQPALGGTVVSEIEELTPSKLAFRVPPTASSGLGLTSLSDALGPEAPYEVDNFRYPWGFAIANAAGRGGGETYDGESKIITPEDLESVFRLLDLHFLGLGYRESAAYKEAEEDEGEVLQEGLCYGFTLLSWELYDDAHGQSKPLGWASSKGFSLAPGSLPYSQTESEVGPHSLTHALMRAAVSQYSPEVQATWQSVASASDLQAKLKAPFAKGEPVPLLIFFSGGGHAMLAFNYQQTPGGGVDVDVVDPNVPFGQGIYRRPEAEAYPKLQVKVSPDGSWEFAGSFGTTFGDLVSGGPGTLKVVPEPRLPGGLLLPSSSPLARLWTYIHPLAGDVVGAIGYSTHGGSGIPADAEPEQIFDDAPDNRVMVPSKHHTITATIDSSAGAPAGVNLTGFGFIDTADLASGQHTVTVGSQTGDLGVPVATGGTTLSVTRVVDGVQRSVSARFAGEVRGPTLSVSGTGQVAITTAGGNGRVSIELATYLPNGERAHARPVRVALHGRARIHRHTPKVKRRKRTKHGRAKRKPRRR